MRILLTVDPEIPVPPLLYGGIERIVDALVRGLCALGHNVGLVAHPDSTVPADQIFHWCGATSIRKVDTLYNMMTLSSAIQQFQPDVVHSFSRIFYLLPFLPTSLPKIMSFQRHPSRHTVKWGATISRGTLHFTGCSSYICKLGGPAGGEWTTIHNFVELEKYTFRSQVAPNAPLAFLSRIERIKGAHTAIAIARQTGRRLLIAGNYKQDDPYWHEEIMPHLGKDGIEYIGPVNDVQKNNLLGQAVALIVPIEWQEPFGIVFAEALACGTPIISCPCGALPEIVRQGVDGYLINNVDEACIAIQNLESIDRGACRQRVEANFSSEVIIKRYEQLYQTLKMGEHK